MEYRKIIKFGNSSHIVTLPNDWLKKNKLNKGDTIYFEENGNNELIFSPRLLKKEKELKEIIINTNDKKVDRVKREIISAYLNDYTTIKISGDNIRKYESDVRQTIQNLMALEIVEQGNNFIIAKDFLDLNTISVDTIVRRMDTILRSMMDDIKNANKNTNFLQIVSRDEDVNRLMFLGIRILRSSLKDPSTAKSLKITSYQVLEHWSIINNIEKIADETKRLARFLEKIKKADKETFERILVLYDKIEATYLNAMKAYYNQDIELAYSLSSAKKNLSEEFTVLYQKNFDKKNIPIITENLKETISVVHNILRRVFS